MSPRKKNLFGYLSFRGEYGRHLPRGRLVEEVYSVSNREHRPLQAADLLAYEMYKEVLNSPPAGKSLPIRKSMLSLMDAQRLFCVELGPHWARSGFRWSLDKEGVNRLRSANRREVIKKLIQAVAGGKVIDKVLDWNTCSSENRRTAENLGVIADNGFESAHERLQFLN